MYAKCLNFPCFITYLAACMHAFCMFYLYVSLGWSVNRTVYDFHVRSTRAFKLEIETFDHLLEVIEVKQF